MSPTIASITRKEVTMLNSSLRLISNRETEQQRVLEKRV